MLDKIALNQNELRLNVEELESRQLLSSVVVVAAGETGLETMQLAVDGQVVQTWEKIGGDANGSQFNWFQYDSEQTLTIDQIEIRFVNDWYDPDNGVDNNLRVNEVKLDGRDYSTTCDSVYSTGTYLPEQGIVPGFHQTDYLHTNGSFYFGQTPPTILFAGKPWSVERNDSPDEVDIDANGNVVLRSTEVPISITRRLTELEPGRLATFSVTSSREIRSGSLSASGRPWASAGINFYDYQGQLILQSRIDINLLLEPETIERSIEVPAEATSAFGWIWVDQQHEEGIDIATIVSDFSLTTVDFSSDIDPPTATMTSFEFTDNNRSEISFLIRLQDNVMLSSSPIVPGGVIVSTPSGGNWGASVRSGVAPFSLNQQNLIYGLNKADGSRWTSADNGVYQVTITENVFSDTAGNYADAIQLGTFTVNITDLPIDVTPPTIQLSAPIPDQLQSTDYVTFSVMTSDDQDSDPQLRNLTLVDPNGNERSITAIAGGFDPNQNRRYEIFWVYQPHGPWGPVDNGVWTIRLDENRLLDSSGNSTSPQILGDFVVNIPSSALRV